MHLNEHGFINIEKHNSIVLVKFIGSINIQTFRDYSKKILDIAISFNGNKWAEVHDLTEWGLAPPEVTEEWIESEKSPLKLKYRCTDIVVISKNNLARKQAVKQSHNDVFLETIFVETVEDALTYLKDKGYIIDNE